MKDSEIKEKILSYFLKFSEFVRQKIGRVNPFIEKYETVVPDFYEFEYKKGNLTYNMGSKIIEKEMINTLALDNSLDNFNKDNNDLKEIFRSLKEKYEVSDHFLSRLFRSLLYSLNYEILEGAEEEAFSNKILVLFNDLELKSSNCRAKAWIDGIWLPKDEFYIRKGVKIRRITPDDLDYCQRTEYYGGIELKHKFMEPTAILELNILPHINENLYISKDKYLNLKTSMETQLKRELEYITLALRLFKLGSVFLHKIEEDLESLIQRSKVTSGDFMRIKTVIRYELTETDIDQINKILDLIRKKKSYIYTKSSPILIALQRYSNAFLNAENLESLVTDVFSCFESIFLGGAERQELSRRLIQRISIFLKPFGVNSIEIYNFLKKGYRIRSIYSHGSRVNFKKEKIENVEVFKTRILECARICLLVYLQIIGAIKKEKLLDLLDRSLLDNGSYQEFIKLINTNNYDINQKSTLINEI